MAMDQLQLQMYLLIEELLLACLQRTCAKSFPKYCAADILFGRLTYANKLYEHCSCVARPAAGVESFVLAEPTAALPGTGVAGGGGGSGGGGSSSARSGFAIAWITLGALAAAAAMAYAGVVAYGTFVRRRVRPNPCAQDDG